MATKKNAFPAFGRQTMGCGDVATLSLQAWINKAQTAVELGHNHGRLIRGQF